MILDKNFCFLTFKLFFSYINFTKKSIKYMFTQKFLSHFYAFMLPINVKLIKKSKRFVEFSFTTFSKKIIHIKALFHIKHYPTRGKHENFYPLLFFLKEQLSRCFLRKANHSIAFYLFGKFFLVVSMLFYNL